MKKLLSFVLVALVFVGLTACGGSDGPKDLTAEGDATPPPDAASAGDLIKFCSAQDDVEAANPALKTDSGPGAGYVRAEASANAFAAAAPPEIKADAQLIADRGAAYYAELKKVDYDATKVDFENAAVKAYSASDNIDAGRRFQEFVQANCNIGS